MVIAQSGIIVGSGVTAAFGVEEFEEAGEDGGFAVIGVTLPLLRGEVGEVGLVFGDDFAARGFPPFFVNFLAPPSE